ncbi:hypothetical protein [Rhodococcus sp. H29-C3]|uniref:hypothetical protein n=1 Tax=Rhodococcus sp. H29-C3 TaxID=3046307 RepID=UPI0024BB21A3|nr:hypothetical protein [Rhodococcus sp. H29-C3]MDJ0359778.1 hypothetical protein [Rhodococcus sp. H29-C3]
MSSRRGIVFASVGLFGAVLTLTACGGDGQQGIPTETRSATATTTPPATTPPSTTPSPVGPAVGEVSTNPEAAGALRAFLTDLDAGGVPAVTAKCWTVPPSEVPARYSDVASILDAAAVPGVDGQYAVTWSSPAITLSVKRSEIASGYACPAVFPGGSSGAYTDTEAEYTVERYLGRFTGTPVNPADLEGDYPLVCDTRAIWDPQRTGAATTAPLANNPGRLTGSASYKPDSVYVAANDGEYTTVYADVTDVSGVEQNRIFTLTVGSNGYCIGDVV